MSYEDTQIVNFKKSDGYPRVSAVALTAGDFVYIDTSGDIAKVASVEETKCVGIVYADAAIGKPVSVIVKGLISVHALVEDTDGSSGYDKAIVAGDQLIISGKAAGTYLVGQAVSAVGGTAQATSVCGMVVGKAVEAVAGSDSADTYTTIMALINFN